jgi:hypothetical protein
MNCPTCKNPIMNPAPNCEWCGSVINHSNENFDNDICNSNYIIEQNLLAAVKLYMDKNNCSLYDVTQAIDKMLMNEKQYYFHDCGNSLSLTCIVCKTPASTDCVCGFFV